MADPTDRDEDDMTDAPGHDYLWDRSGPPDPDIARLEALLAPLAHDQATPLRLPEAPASPSAAGVDELARRRTRRGLRPRAIAAAALVAAAAAVIAIVLLRTRDPGHPVVAGCDRGAGFAFSSAAEVRCDGGQAARGTLAVGSWIETADGAAEVTVANIGAVQLQPRSRLALRSSGPGEQRLALEHGALHARVSAPPRLFIVETPSATAVDLGCEYDLAVGADGNGTLTVVTGEVELAAASGALVVVPAGTAAPFSPHGVGLPVATASSQTLRDAVAAFDPARPATVDAILSAAGDGDQVTLINLLALAAPYQREAVYDALEELSPAPEDVLRDAIIAGDPESIARWRAAVIGGWAIGRPALKPCKTPDETMCTPAGKQKVDPHTPLDPGRGTWPAPDPGAMTSSPDASDNPLPALDAPPATWGSGAGSGSSWGP